MSEPLRYRGMGERFIPLSKAAIIVHLTAPAAWDGNRHEDFARFCRLLVAVYHHKFREKLEQLKQAYLPFSPDRDTLAVLQYGEKQREHLHQYLVKEIRGLLVRANYELLGVNDLKHAFSQLSPYGLELEVDLGDFDDVIVSYRGSGTRTDRRRTLKNLYLFKEVIEVPVYRRLFVMLKLKSGEQRIRELMDEYGLTQQQAAARVRKARWGLPEMMNERHIYIKLFKQIPKTDLEMLFPNTRVRLKLFDKIKLSVTCGGGTISGLAATATKLTVAVSALGVASALGGLIAVIARQVTKIFTQRTRYMMVLAQNLYFHNLANNRGVLGLLLDRAEEEECKEIILAYYFLVRYPDRTRSKNALGREVNDYLRSTFGAAIEFDIDDAVRKLREGGLLVYSKDTRLQAVDLSTACRRLTVLWERTLSHASHDGLTHLMDTDVEELVG
jgi:hypothetical protein